VRVHFAATFYFFNMLQQVLSQLAIYSTNTVNIGLVKCKDNQANLNIAQVLKISKLVTCLCEHIENHILKGSYPNFLQLPQGTQIQNINQCTWQLQQLILWKNMLSPHKKLSQMCPLPSLPFAIGITKSKNSSPVLVQRTSLKQAFSTARKEPQFLICSPQI
jgi:hypothetical protein